MGLYASTTFQTIRSSFIQHQAPRALAFVADAREDACVFGHRHIEQREAHQPGVSFRQEYRRLLKSYGIEFPDHYLRD